MLVRSWAERVLQGRHSIPGNALHALPGLRAARVLVRHDRRSRHGARSERGRVMTDVTAALTIFAVLAAFVAIGRCIDRRKP